MPGRHGGDEYKSRHSGKYVSFATLVRVVDTEERLGHLARELRFHVLFIIFFVAYVLLQANVRIRNETEMAMRELFERTPFPYPVVPGTATGADTPPGLREGNGTFSQSLYLRFSEISNEAEYWSWVNNVVYTRVLLDGRDNNFYINGQNKLLWGIRFRQLRVLENVDCQVPPAMDNMQSLMGPCFPAFSLSTEATSVPDPRFHWRWYQSQVLNERDFTGEVSSYPGSGFNVTFLITENQTATHSKLQSMQIAPTKYIDKQTRAVFLVLTVYNPNYNTFCYIQILTEFSAGGTVYPSALYRSAIILQPDGGGTMLLVLVIVVDIFIVVFIFRFISDLRNLRRVSLWIILDLISVVLFGIQFWYSIVSFFLKQPSNDLETALASTEFYAGVGNTLSLVVTMQSIYAVNMILTAFRVFKYLKISKGLALMWGTIVRAIKDIVFFFVLFTVMFIGFVVCAYLVFGPSLNDYRTLAGSISTLLRVMLGEMNYFELKAANPVFAPIFFATFTILFIFTLLNIFFAIMLDAWRLEAEARSQLKENTESLDFMKIGRDSFLWLSMSCSRMCREPSKNCIPSCRAFCRTLCTRKKRGWMSKSEVLERLQSWKKKKKNRNNPEKDFLGFDDIKSAMQGELKNFEYVQNEQIDAILDSVSKYLVDDKHRRRLISEGMTTGEAGLDDVEDGEGSTSSLKRLYGSFKLLKENQLRLVGVLDNRMDSLKVVQQQTFEKIANIDRRCSILTS